MNKIISSGLICVKNQCNVEFAVCRIDYFLYEDETFKYVFTPYYDVIDLLDSDLFQGIPGLDLDLRDREYIRENIIPVFVSERVPSENREDLYELLESVNMNYMDPIQYLVRSRMKYSGDDFYVIEYTDRKTIELTENIGKTNSFGSIKIILNHLAHGNKVLINGELIHPEKSFFDALLFIYQKGYQGMMESQRKGIDRRKAESGYKGRKPMPIDKLSFLEQLERVTKGEISSRAAAKNLGISIDRYYRYRNKLAE